jgi:hypothetical protein
MAGAPKKVPNLAATRRALADQLNDAAIERQKLSGRQDGFEQWREGHEKRCEERYAELRGDIAGLGEQIGQLAQEQRDATIAAKAVAEAKAELTQPKWWHPWIGRVIWGAILAVTALVGSLVATDWNQNLIMARMQARPPAAGTVAAPQPVVVQAPAQSAQPPAGEGIPAEPN